MSNNRKRARKFLWRDLCLKAMMTCGRFSYTPSDIETILTLMGVELPAVEDPSNSISGTISRELRLEGESSAFFRIGYGRYALRSDVEDDAEIEPFDVIDFATKTGKRKQCEDIIKNIKRRDKILRHEIKRKSSKNEPQTTVAKKTEKQTTTNYLSYAVIFLAFILASIIANLIISTLTH